MALHSSNFQIFVAYYASYGNNSPVALHSSNFQIFVAYYASYGHIVNAHLKMELGLRAISLLNSSWHVKSANDPNMEFPTDSQTLRMLDLTVAPPFGPFTKPMKKAIFNFMRALACSAAAARDPIKVKVDLTSAKWGDESMQHTDL